MSLTDSNVNVSTTPTVAPDVPPASGSIWSGMSVAARTAVVGAAGVVATVGAMVAPTMQGPAQPPDLSTINGCSMEGNAKAGQWQMTANPLKNRYTFPSGESYDPSATLTGMVDAGTTDSTGNPKTVTGVAGLFNEQNSAEIEGWITHVKVGGDESCNCNTNDVQYMDTHIYVGATATTPDSQCVIVEVTPRIRQLMSQQGVDWSTNTLISTLTHQYVRISGWLFYDQEHWENASDNPQHASLVWRASCWEIHPVTDIQIEANPPAAPQ